MYFLSCIDEAGVFGLSSDWICNQVLFTPLTLKRPELLGNSQRASEWETRLTCLPGLRQVVVCSLRGRITLKFDLRRWSRSELLHRICAATSE